MKVDYCNKISQPCISLDWGTNNQLLGLVKSAPPQMFSPPPKELWNTRSGEDQLRTYCGSHADGASAVYVTYAEDINIGPRGRDAFFALAVLCKMKFERIHVIEDKGKPVFKIFRLL